jgi:hypothetical protein
MPASRQPQHALHGERPTSIDPGPDHNGGCGRGPGDGNRSRTWLIRRGPSLIRSVRQPNPSPPLGQASEAAVTCPGFADPRVLQNPQHQVCGVPGHVDDLVLRLAVPGWPDDGLLRDLFGEAFGRAGSAVGRVDCDGG